MRGQYRYGLQCKTSDRVHVILDIPSPSLCLLGLDGNTEKDSLSRENRMPRSRTDRPN